MLSRAAPASQTEGEKCSLSETNWNLLGQLSESIFAVYIERLAIRQGELFELEVAVNSETLGPSDYRNCPVRA